MRVLVCGGREYANMMAMARVFDDLPDGTVIIHGGARGADSLAGECAKHNDFAVEVYKADWVTHGKAAGAIRNQRMLDEGCPELVIAFPGGRGTADMVSRARKAGIPVRLIYEGDA